MYVYWKYKCEWFLPVLAKLTITITVCLWVVAKALLCGYEGVLSVFLFFLHADMWLVNDLFKSITPGMSNNK